MTTETTSRSGDITSTQPSGRLQEAASGIADSAGQAAETQAARGLDRATEILEQVASAVRESGNQIRPQRPEIAGIADTGAQRIEELANTLREKEPREILDDVEQFARRQPALVIGGGLLAGLAIGRILRTGSETATPNGRRVGVMEYSRTSPSMSASTMSRSTTPQSTVSTTTPKLPRTSARSSTSSGSTGMTTSRSTTSKSSGSTSTSGA